MRVPYLSAPKGSWATVARMPEPQYTEYRWELVRRIATSEGVDIDTFPAGWREGPLRAWCGVVLTVNGVTLPETPAPLSQFGVDFGLMPDPSINEWIWTIS